MTRSEAAATPVARRGRTPIALAAAVVAAAAVAAAVGPFAVTAGTARLATWTIVTAGASVVVWRSGAVDLGLAAVVAVGAYGGGVAVGAAGLPPALGPVLGAMAGAVGGTATGAVAGRVGGGLAALPTLSLTLAVGAVLPTMAWTGGVAGYHAVPFLTGGDRGDAVAATLLAGAALVVAGGWSRSRRAARASVAVRSPAVAVALGHRPAGDAALAGAVGGALLGLGGAVQAMVAGSVTPAAYGLGLAAALALAAVLGGIAPLGPVVGAGVIWGPGVAFPLVPLVGDAPPLLVAGLIGLGILVVRRGRPVCPATARPAPIGSGHGPVGRRAAPESDAPPVLAVRPADGFPGLQVRPGRIVAVVGPNGVGKSTLLGRIGGQVPDGGSVTLHGRPAPRGARARARAGLARTWQRPPDVPGADLLLAAGTAAGATGATARAVAAALGTDLEGAAADPAVGQVVAATLRGPDVVLLDEPAATLPESRVAAAVRVLADAGLAVVLTDHRPDVVAVADDVVRMEGRPA